MATRSGRNLRERNSAYSYSYEECLNRHRRLATEEATSRIREIPVHGAVGRLVIHTLRFPFDSTRIRQRLLEYFRPLFLAQDEERGHVFELFVTFNFILHNVDQGTFSVFYGQDFSNASSLVNSRAQYGNRYVIDALDDLENVPTTFDIDDIIEYLSQFFENSHVSVFDVLNAVYIISEYQS